MPPAKKRAASATHTRKSSVTARATKPTRMRSRPAKSSRGPVPVTPAPPIDPRLAQRAYERLLPAYRALPSSSLLRITIDVASAASVALRAIEQLEPLRPEFTATFRAFDVHDLDRLRDLALGTWYAALQARPTAAEADTFDKLLTEGNELREQFVIASTALAARKLFDAKTLADLRDGAGYRDLAGDLTTFASIYTKNKSRYANKTAIEPSEVKRAAEIGTLLFEFAAKRERAASALSTATDIKQRAWTLLTRSYEQIRRAVSYLRWEQGDADAIAPSLFAIRGSGRHSVRNATSTSAPSTSPATTSTTTPPEAPHESGDDPGIDAVQERNEPSAKPRPGARGGDPFG